MIGIGFQVVEPEWATSWEIRNNIASRYRNGRLIICGDASHVHSPSGGQAMNGCMQGESSPYQSYIMSTAEFMQQRLHQLVSCCLVKKFLCSKMSSVLFHRYTLLISFADAFNLGWKLAAVWKGHATPRYLRHIRKRKETHRRANQQRSRGNPRDRHGIWHRPCRKTPPHAGPRLGEDDHQPSFRPLT